jgi:hypothetical protein
MTCFLKFHNDAIVKYFNFNKKAQGYFAHKDSKRLVSKPGVAIICY